MVGNYLDWQLSGYIKLIFLDENKPNGMSISASNDPDSLKRTRPKLKNTDITSVRVLVEQNQLIK